MHKYPVCIAAILWCACVSAPPANLNRPPATAAPWIASLGDTVSTSAPFCVGTLITVNWLLTNGQCLAEHYKDAEELQAKFCHNWSTCPSDRIYKFTQENIYAYPPKLNEKRQCDGFVSSCFRNGNIGLVNLPQGVRNVALAILAPYGRRPLMGDGQVYGWDLYYNPELPKMNLVTATLHIRRNGSCASGVGAVPPIANTTKVCTVGGGATLRLGYANGAPFVQDGIITAVVSETFDFDRVPLQPGFALMETVSFYARWMEQLINARNDDHIVACKEKGGKCTKSCPKWRRTIDNCWCPHLQFCCGPDEEPQASKKKQQKKKNKISRRSMNNKTLIEDDNDHDVNATSTSEVKKVRLTICTLIPQAHNRAACTKIKTSLPIG